MSGATEIANRALQCLGDTPILDIGDNNERARIMRRAYDPVRKAELRKHIWNFARKRAVLAPEATGPIFGFKYSYATPPDCLRILPPQDARDWTVEGRKILTDCGPALNLPYIADITDPNMMDEIFVEAFAKKLAMETAEKITQSTSKRELAQQEYREAIAEGRRTGAFEQIPQEFPEDDWLLARY
jgi:hypothetical protein